GAAARSLPGRGAGPRALSALPALAPELLLPLPAAARGGLGREVARASAAAVTPGGGEARLSARGPARRLADRDGRATGPRAPGGRVARGGARARPSAAVHAASGRRAGLADRGLAGRGLVSHAAILVGTGRRA